MRRRRIPNSRPGAAGRAVLITLMVAVAVGVGLHLTGRVNFASSPPEYAEINAPAPDFELEEVGTGKKVRLADLRGKPVVLNFWCGCQLCRPVAVHWAESRPRIEDILPETVMLAVFGDHSAYNPVIVKDFKWGTGWEWSVLADVGTRVGLRYRSVDCPRCWVIDARGVIRWANKDRMDSPETIVNGAVAAVRSLLKG